MFEYIFSTLGESILCRSVQQCWVLDTQSNQTLLLSLPGYAVKNDQRWNFQNHQIICSPNKTSKCTKMLKLKLPQALIPHITSTFGKVPLTLAAYSNMDEQFLSNFSNELSTNRHVLLGTHADFSVPSIPLKINNFSKMLCKKRHSKMYILVYY